LLERSYAVEEHSRHFRRASRDFLLDAFTPAPLDIRPASFWKKQFLRRQQTTRNFAWRNYRNRIGN
jgi:hypothetical protein